MAYLSICVGLDIAKNVARLLIRIKRCNVYIVPSVNYEDLFCLFDEPHPRAIMYCHQVSAAIVTCCKTKEVA